MRNINDHDCDSDGDGIGRNRLYLFQDGNGKLDYGEFVKMLLRV